MKQVHLHGKTFNEKDFYRLVIGGQNAADTIRFVVPKQFEGELNLDTWTWSITYENKDGNGDTVYLSVTPSSKDPELIYLDWIPSQTATQIAGKLECQVFAVLQDGDTQKRFTTAPFPIYVEKWLNPDPITQSNPTVIEQALELMSKYNQDVQNAIQAGTNAAKSEEAAAQSKEAAEVSASEAKKSQDAAAASQQSAATSASEAKKSQDAASDSEAKAKDWATKDDTPVEGELYSSKHYAGEAANDRASVDEMLIEIRELKQQINSINGSIQGMMDMVIGRNWTIGDGSTTSFDIQHNYQPFRYQVQIWSTQEGGKIPFYKVRRNSSGTLNITFETAPPADSVIVSIHGLINEAG